MTVITPTLPQHGTTLCGQSLAQSDDDSLYACYDLGALGVGVTYEVGASVPYLRLTPSVQVPPFAREAVKELLFTHEDDRFGDLSVDNDDGEVVMRRTPRAGSSPEDELRDCLAFLGTVAYSAILESIRRSEPRAGQ